MLNILIVWSLTGLWHGANWNFVAWGAYYGLLLLIEKYVLRSVIDKIPNTIRHIITMLIVIVGWTFFSITDTGEMLRYLTTMFGRGNACVVNATTLYYLKTNAVLLIAGIVACTPAPMRRFKKVNETMPNIGLVAIVIVFVISVAYLVFGSYNPFLYFRF